MKKAQRTTRKLTLEPETVRWLTHRELVAVDAGAPGVSAIDPSACLLTTRCYQASPRSSHTREDTWMP
jgi:hypothetical protein